MSSPLQLFLKRWLINTVAVLVAANIVPGIEYDRVSGLLIASLLLGILNALLRPLLLILSLPLVVLSLGLFTLVINAFMLLFVGQLVKTFHVIGFWPAFWGGLVVSFVSIVLNTLTGTGEHRFEWQRQRSRRHQGPPNGSGPIIDV